MPRHPFIVATLLAALASGPVCIVVEMVPEQNSFPPLGPLLDKEDIVLKDRWLPPKKYKKFTKFSDPHAYKGRRSMASTRVVRDR
jgi:hypothetical protein